jgi:IS5 family transposase
MLRMHCLQLWFNPSHPAVEEALYDAAATRRFVDIDLGLESAPGEVTACRIRHLLKRMKSRQTLLNAVKDQPRHNVIKMPN